MQPVPVQLNIKDNGIFPGSKFPVLLYKAVLNLPKFFPSAYVKNKFSQHGWTNTWRNGIYTYHHYHSNTHEAMGVIKGHTTLLLGGENGTQVTLKKGDVIIIPAGVAHKNMGHMKDVICVGAYPEGCDFDMNYGNAGERPQTDATIAGIPFPSTGSVAGIQDPLLHIWNGKTLAEKSSYKTFLN